MGNKQLQLKPAEKSTNVESDQQENEQNIQKLQQTNLTLLEIYKIAGLQSNGVREFIFPKVELTTLFISDNHNFAKTIKSLEANPSNFDNIKSLQVIWIGKLNNNEFSKLLSYHLIPKLSLFTHVAHLHFTGITHSGPAEGKALSLALAKLALTELQLEIKENHITSEGLHLICDSIGNNSTFLTSLSLNLQENSLTHLSGNHIQKMLIQCKALHKLVLKFSLDEITIEGILSIEEAFASSTNLQQNLQQLEFIFSFTGAPNADLLQQNRYNPDKINVQKCSGAFMSLNQLATLRHFSLELNLAFEAEAEECQLFLVRNLKTFIEAHPLKQLILSIYDFSQNSSSLEAFCSNDQQQQQAIYQMSQKSLLQCINFSVTFSTINPETQAKIAHYFGELQSKHQFRTVNFISYQEMKSNKTEEVRFQGTSKQEDQLLHALEVGFLFYDMSLFTQQLLLSFIHSLKNQIEQEQILSLSLRPDFRSRDSSQLQWNSFLDIISLNLSQLQFLSRFTLYMVPQTQSEGGGEWSMLDFMSKLKGFIFLNNLNIIFTKEFTFTQLFQSPTQIYAFFDICLNNMPLLQYVKINHNLITHTYKNTLNNKLISFYDYSEKNFNTVFVKQKNHALVILCNMIKNVKYKCRIINDIFSFISIPEMYTPFIKIQENPEEQSENQYIHQFF